ncbi:MAG: ATP-dependent DNA ligase [Candidatus Dormibacteria bacterium]
MLPVNPPLTPMLARLEEEIPRGEDWRYEPKWDGFRALVFRDEDSIRIMSRKGQPLDRYFPEVVEALSEALPARAVVDGEIVIAGEVGLDFGALQLRLHPAASRVNRLALETPAEFVAFDLLAESSRDLRTTPFDERRSLLRTNLVVSRRVSLTPQTSDPDAAADWFVRYEGAGCDGIIAKRGDGPYLAGERVMVKIKHRRSVDCVVGGYRVARTGSGVASLLLGLYDGDGVLGYVGHTSSFSAAERRQVRELLAPLEGRPSFGAGRSPGGPSRWSQGTEQDWVSVDPSLTCEVSFDYLQGPRFRHAARFLRWRPDKAPRECDVDQLTPPNPFSLDQVLGR